MTTRELQQRTGVWDDRALWAILPDTYEQLAAAAAAGVTDLAGPVPEAARMNPSGGRATGGAVDVIPIHGVIRHRPSLLSILFGGGGATVGRIRTMLRESLSDPQVGAIVLSIDSPGGIVFGIPELAEEIREARDRKPIVAVADPFAASAAYFLGSQATEVMVTPSGQAGSIGVVLAHTEFSAMDARIGVKTTLVRAGAHKVERNSYEPLSDDARASIQAEVDTYHDMFLEAVAAGRGVTAEKVAADYGQGRMLLADDALAAGMVDAIGTVEDAVARAAELASSSRRGGSQAQGTGYAQDGLLTVAQARELLGMPPVDDDPPAETTETPAETDQVDAPAADDGDDTPDVWAELAATSPSFRAADAATPSGPGETA